MAKITINSNFDLLSKKYNNNGEITEYASVECDSKDEALRLSWDMLEWLKQHIETISGYAFNVTELYIDTDEGVFEYDDSVTTLYIWIYKD